MKRLLIILLTTTGVLQSLAQFHQRIYFNELYNQNTWSAGISLIEVDSNYFIAGITSDSIVGYKNILILKLSLEGNLEFRKEFRVNNSNHYPGFPGSLNSYYDTAFILGGSHDVGNASCGLYLQFSKSFDTAVSNSYCSNVENFLFFRHCNITNANDLIFTGYERQNDQTGDVFILKSTSEGNELWRTNYGFETVSEGQKIIQTNDGGYIISGYTYTPTNEYSGNSLLIKVDSLGTMEWYRTPGHPDYRDGYGSVTIAQDGNYVFCYTHAIFQPPPYPVPPSIRKIKFMKFNQQGDTLWEKLYGIPRIINMTRNIITLQDGSFIATGYAISDTVSGSYWGWLFKINQYGDSIWFRDYYYYDNSTGTSINALYDVFEASDGGLVACGEASHLDYPPDMIQRMWVLKVDSVGCTEPNCDPTVGVQDDRTGGRYDGMTVGLEVWPNPCSSVVSVSITGSQVGQLDSWQLDKFAIEVYDIFGRKLGDKVFSSTRMGGGREGGWRMDVSALPPGLYLLVVKDGTTVKASAKFVVAR